MKIIKTIAKGKVMHQYYLTLEFPELEASGFLFENNRGDDSEEWARYKARKDADRARIETESLTRVRHALKGLGAWGEVTDSEPK